MDDKLYSHTINSVVITKQVITNQVNNNVLNTNGRIYTKEALVNAYGRFLKAVIRQERKEKIEKINAKTTLYIQDKE
jgi:late competence protein required for DNA uptake (superfamily II DNA/RNA helicase)